MNKISTRSRRGHRHTQHGVRDARPPASPRRPTRRRRRREPADEIRRARPRRNAPSANDHRGADPAAAGRHEPAQGDREHARRQLPSGRSVRLVRVVDAHHGARLQSEPHGLHARRRAARRHDLRQPQRPAHQPRDSDRARRARRAVAGHRHARDGVRRAISAARSSSSPPRRASEFDVDARRRSAATRRGARTSTSTRASSARGTRLSIAAADNSTEKWKGAGDQDVRQYNFKLAQPVGEGELTVFYNYSDRVEIDYQDLSKDIVARRGSDWDN